MIALMATMVAYTQVWRSACLDPLMHHKVKYHLRPCPSPCLPARLPLTLPATPSPPFRLVQFLQLLAMIMYSVAWVRWEDGGWGGGEVGTWLETVGGGMY